MAYPTRRLVALGAGLAATDALALAAPTEAAAVDRSQKTRVLNWSGGDRLGVAVPAEVRFVPGAANKVTITGPADMIRDIVVDEGVIRYERPWRWRRWWAWWDWGDVWNWRSGPMIRITVVVPHLSAAHVSGAGRLDLGRLSQDRLELAVSGAGMASAGGAIRSLEAVVSGSGGVRLSGLSSSDMGAVISGSGWIAADGTCESLHLAISGSGHGDFGGLNLQDAQAFLSGSGSAKLSPHRTATLRVSGAGSIRLLTEPARLDASRSGAGSIISPGRG